MSGVIYLWGDIDIKPGSKSLPFSSKKEMLAIIKTLTEDFLVRFD